VHALYGGLRLQGRRVRATVGARTQLFLLLGAFVLLKGVAYWFDRYGIDFSERGTVTTGASYTDVNAVLPAKTVLAVIAVLCAVLFFAGAVRRSTMLPAVGFGLLVPAVISETFQQLQQVKGFYQFPGMLSVDRYRLAGGGTLPQDMVVAVRGMGGPPQGQGNWVNTHLVYTHGFGFVAAKAEAVGPGG